MRLAPLIFFSLMVSEAADAADWRLSFYGKTTDRYLELVFDVENVASNQSAARLESRPVRVALGTKGSLRPYEVLRMHSTEARQAMYLDLATGLRLTLILPGTRRGSFVRAQTPDLLNLMYTRMATGAQPTEIWAIENRLDLWGESTGELFESLTDHPATNKSTLGR